MIYTSIKLDQATARAMVKKSLLMSGNVMDLTYPSEHFLWKNYSAELYNQWVRQGVLFREMATFEPDLILFCIDELSIHVVNSIVGE